jgi:GDP/UDP-N,N'-diacetylbacillosamine 2-epimerase (hydrolysing)
MKRKVLFYSVARSDYDRYQPILENLDKRKIDFAIALNSVHLSPKFGFTFKFIDKKFKIFKPNYITNNFRDESDLIDNFSRSINFLKKIFKNYKPDLLVVLGDRYEMLCAPICAIQYNIPIIHFYGGSTTTGSIDEYIRNAITKMSHYHFVATQQYKNKISKINQKNNNIKVTGLIGFEKSIKKKIINKKNFFRKIKLHPQKFVLLSFHPETKTKIDLEFQLKFFEQIIKKIKIRFIISYPNADLGNQKIINFYKKIAKSCANVTIIKNCGQDLFLNFINYSHLMIGNSSSGIVEASFFDKTFINIGSRQNGKVMPKNVYNVRWSEKNIVNIINNLLKEKVNKKIFLTSNPYKERISASKISKFISSTNLTNLKNN